MLKRLLLITLLLPITAFAAKKECGVKPSYDITINKESVHIFNKKDDLTIMPNGNVVLNNRSILPNPSLQKKLVYFQQDLRQQLPQLEQQSLNLLLEVKMTFEQAIKKHLSYDSELKSELNKLYKRLVKLLHGSISTENGNTRFSYQNFNNLKKDGEDIGQHIFYNVAGGSILHLNFFKNLEAIKTISKNEWKAQKPKLKAFDAHICSVITGIDTQYEQILMQLNQSIHK
ncbi:MULTISPECIES: DUF2884 family protein [unclassified Gilliamella]|uniref:DUF2884 family protein n=1 Tax=unclassified Gilliamella TaxID=2685620 RepID=UPI0013076AF0|nr:MULTISPECIES: DUF2884 family protein [unclassified Gilliamella]MWP48907.1 DUF2884 family protein [Gilliamella sp. Lep-s35]MWP68749.1 DUF2884 family protein [Gilliamella sp. Lep-s5]MWP77178.1 DUF2884 family protein [Gilliamella sp. Lep-s21]